MQVGGGDVVVEMDVLKSNSGCLSDDDDSKEEHHHV